MCLAQEIKTRVTAMFVTSPARALQAKMEEVVYQSLLFTTHFYVVRVKLGFGNKKLSWPNNLHRPLLLL